MAGHLSLLNISRKISNDNYAETGSPNGGLIEVYNAFQIIGFVLLAAILSTALFSRNVHRISTWFSFILSWMVSCFSCLLLAGRQVGPEPDFGICVVQAALIYAAPPFTGFASLAFLIQLYLTMNSTLSQAEVNPRYVLFLLLFPPVIHVAVSLGVFALALQNPTSVERDVAGMFCHLNTGIATKITIALVILSVVIILIFQAVIAITLRRNWAAFLLIRRTGSTNFSLGMVVRVSLFSVAPILVLTIDLVSIHYRPKETAVLNILVATFPTAAALIFGSQMDIVRVWMFWAGWRKTSAQGSDMLILYYFSSSCTPWHQLFAAYKLVSVTVLGWLCETTMVEPGTRRESSSRHDIHLDGIGVL